MGWRVACLLLAALGSFELYQGWNFHHWLLKLILLLWVVAWFCLSFESSSEQQKEEAR